MRHLFKIQLKGAEPIYFCTRDQAKRWMQSEGLRAKDVKINRGPDHWKGETDGSFVNTPSSKRETR